MQASLTAGCKKSLRKLTYYRQIEDIIDGLAHEYRNEATYQQFSVNMLLQLLPLLNTKNIFRQYTNKHTWLRDKQEYGAREIVYRYTTTSLYGSGSTRLSIPSMTLSSPVISPSGTSSTSSPTIWSIPRTGRNGCLPAKHGLCPRMDAGTDSYRRNIQGTDGTCQLAHTHQRYHFGTGRAQPLPLPFTDSEVVNRILEIELQREIPRLRSPVWQEELHRVYGRKH